MARSRQLAGLGNIAAKDGHFSEAVRRFTEAIDLYPFDHRSVSKGREGLHVTVVYLPCVL